MKAQRSARAPALPMSVAALAAILGVAAVAAALAVQQLGLRRPPAGADTLHVSQLQCGPKDLQHLSELPSQGLHVLAAAAACEAGNDECRGDFTVSVFVDGFGDGAQIRNATASAPFLMRPSRHTSVREMLLRPVQEAVRRDRPLLHEHLRRSIGSMLVDTMLKHSAPAPRWKLFTPYGTPLPMNDVGLVAAAFAKCGTLYLVEGGNFVWPGIRVGHNRTLTLEDGQAVVLTTRSLIPKVFTVRGVGGPTLTPKEREWVIGQAEPSLGASKVQAKAGRTQTQSSVRSSSQVRIASGSWSSVVSAIEGRAHGILRVPSTHGEPLQVVRYRTGELYQHHTDYFRPAQAQDPAMAAMLSDPTGRPRNRLATLLWSVTSPPDGGETHFPYSHVNEPSASAQRREGALCDGRGLTLAPVQGEATLFYSLRADGAVDSFSQHAGCPSETGVKWACGPTDALSTRDSAPVLLVTLCGWDRMNKWVWSADVSDPMLPIHSRARTTKP